ncbi:bifunctional oligoribonuclease/PAP phosphatase NrnA [Venenivibrio stagnispumantis]|uniref:Phosphoesterase RecJ domain-containing protein n=1 Tax=Venenivibrio stagnispumantis TaxID=407998 RepID=A0AA45WPE6_9AQUI|nr:phosphoesterase RecJ domain-containing protein [Venenivibrio stagnispumantis]
MEGYVIPIIERLKREEGSILIFTHENPDGDGIGSMLALYQFLKKKNKNVVAAMKDNVPHIYDFLPYNQEIKKLPLDKTFDVGIIVDAAGAYRAGVEIKAKEILRIDHHIGGVFESIYDYINPYAAATTYLVGEILRNWDEEAIDADIATCLYVGLMTDTGSFRYNNTNEKTFEMAEFLVKKGANPSYISHMVFERNSLNVLKLLQKTLSTIELYEDGKIAVLTVFRDFLEETGTTEEDTEGFVHFARGLDGVEVAIIMIQREDRKTWRISIRGKGKVDVQKIAKCFGGGGHKDAAGCRVIGDYHEVKQKLINEIATNLSKYEELVEVK